MGNEQPNQLREVADVLSRAGYTKAVVILRSAADELDRLTKALAATEHEVQQILGKALGYAPLYPEASEVDDGQVCVGEHTAVTIAMEAVEKIGSLTKSLEESQFLHRNQMNNAYLAMLRAETAEAARKERTEDA